MIQHSELISMLNFPQNPSGTDSMAWVSFPELTITAPGTYTYTLRETSSSGNGWATDNRTYRAVVTVTENGTGSCYHKSIKKRSWGRPFSGRIFLRTV